MTSSSRGPHTPSTLPGSLSVAECKGVALNGTPPKRAEAAPKPIPEGPSEATHAGSPPQPRTSPPSEGPAIGADVNKFGTNVDVLGSWKPSPIDLSRAEVNPNWRMWRPTRSGTISSGIHCNRRMQKRRRASRETHCSPPGASRCESHPDVEIVSSAQSQHVVPLVELSSDDEIEKPA